MLRRELAPWIVTTYGLVFGSFVVLPGRLGDVVGRWLDPIFSAIYHPAASTRRALGPRLTQARQPRL